MIPRNKLLIGKFYRFKHKLSKVSGGMPAMVTVREGQLIQLRDRGEMIFQVDEITWDIPDGLSPSGHMAMTNEAFKKRYGHGKKTKIVTRLYRTKGPVIEELDGDEKRMPRSLVLVK